MGNFSEYVGSQFGNPHGAVGRICCFIMNRMNKEMYKKTVSLIDADDDGRILDIGYGNGYLLKCLSEHTGADLYGVDISEDMKHQAEKKNRKAQKEGRLFLSVGDCCDLPFDDDYFDAITSINTIYFWNDAEKGLSEIRRTLREGCSFFNVVYSKEYLDSISYTRTGFKKYEKEQIIDFGRQVGFDDISVHDIVKGKSFVVMYTK